MNPTEKKILRTVVGLIVAYFLSLWLKGKELSALMTTILSGVGGQVAAAALVP
jgi:hypothetical protein